MHRFIATDPAGKNLFLSAGWRRLAILAGLVDEDYGSVWDVERQGRLLIDPTLLPVNYHPLSREFLSVLPDGVWILSSLID